MKPSDIYVDSVVADLDNSKSSNPMNKNTTHFLNLRTFWLAKLRKKKLKNKKPSKSTRKSIDKCFITSKGLCGKLKRKGTIDRKSEEKLVGDKKQGRQREWQNCIVNLHKFHKGFNFNFNFNKGKNEKKLKVKLIEINLEKVRTKSSTILLWLFISSQIPYQTL